MLPQAAILILALQDPAPAPAQTEPPEKSEAIVARIRGSYLHVRIEIPGFTDADRHTGVRKRIYGDRAVVVGSMPAKLAGIEILAEAVPGEGLTDEAWRDENISGSGARWVEFEACGMACAELSVLMDGSGSHDMHAFAVRGGYRFDVHLSEALSATREAEFTQVAFGELLASFRLAIVRRGTWDQMPPSAIEIMDSALRLPGDWKAAVAARAEERPDAYAIPFATAELLLFRQAPPAEPIAAYTRAIELLDANLAARSAEKKSLSAAETLALAASEDGLAIALIDAGEPAKAIPHLERGLVIAHDLTAPVRAGLLYNLACAHARLGHEEIAIEKLLESESSETGALNRARFDKDFDPIRESERFRNLVSGDRRNQ